jgi:ferric-dicitrate binding protein FerR (iron transport regulator)
MNGLHDILEPENPIDPDELMRYLEGTASKEERFAIENLMADSSFVNDAVEGLQGFADTVQIAKLTAELNKQLHKQTEKKRKRKNKRKLADQNWLLIAILGILFLSVLGYLIIHFSLIKHA